MALMHEEQKIKPRIPKHNAAPVEITRTPRGAPTLAPAPPGAVHPEPTNTLPIPASVPGEGVRPDTVAATTGLSEPPGSAGSWGRRSWIPFRRRAQDSDDSEAQHLEGEVNGHDYATTGTNTTDREAEQYADDVVDWLDVIGEHCLSFVSPGFRSFGPALRCFLGSSGISLCVLANISYANTCQSAPHLDACGHFSVWSERSHSSCLDMLFCASSYHYDIPPQLRLDFEPCTMVAVVLLHYMLVKGQGRLLIPDSIIPWHAAAARASI